MNNISPKYYCNRARSNIVIFVIFICVFFVFNGCSNSLPGSDSSGEGEEPDSFLTYMSVSGNRELTWGDLDSNSLITFDESLPAGTEWMVTISDGTDTYAFEGVLQGDETGIGIFLGTQNTDAGQGYTSTVWSSAAFLGLKSPVTISASVGEESEIFDSITTEPYGIYTWKGLDAMRNDLTASYTVRADISFPEPGEGGFPTAGFEPVGSTNLPFSGSLDGMGHSISNLFINRPMSTYVGLFGFIEKDVAAVEIKNVEINLRPVDTSYAFSILGNEYVGSLAGSIQIDVEVVNVHINGGVVATETARGGGFAGESKGNIRRSSTTEVNVEIQGANVATSQQGGFVCEFLGGLIEDSYSSGGRVTGGSVDIGGFVGYSTAQAGMISRSYANNEVLEVNSNTPTKSGVFIGNQRSITIDSVYSRTQTSGITDLVGLSVGIGTVTGIADATSLEDRSGSYYDDDGDKTTITGGNEVFNDWDFSTVWQWNDGEWPTLRR